MKLPERIARLMGLEGPAEGEQIDPATLELAKKMLSPEQLEEVMEATRAGITPEEVEAEPEEEPAKPKGESLAETAQRIKAAKQARENAVSTILGRD